MTNNKKQNKKEKMSNILKKGDISNAMYIKMDIENDNRTMELKSKGLCKDVIGIINSYFEYHDHINVLRGLFDYGDVINQKFFINRSFHLHTGRLDIHKPFESNKNIIRKFGNGLNDYNLPIVGALWFKRYRGKYYGAGDHMQQHYDQLWYHNAYKGGFGFTCDMRQELKIRKIKTYADLINPRDMTLKEELKLRELFRF